MSEVEIEDNKEIPVFFEEPKKTVGRKKAAPKPVDTMLEAIKFLGIPLKKTGMTQETHVRLSDGWGFASNEEITVGCKLPFQVDAVVNYAQLLEAKKDAGLQFSVTQVSDDALSVVYEGHRRMIGCGSARVWGMPTIDPQIAPADESLRVALLGVLPAAPDKPDSPTLAGIFATAWFTVATDRRVIIQHAHKVNMPAVRLPIVFVKKLKTVKKEIVGFGFSDVSFTVWFYDGSFMRTAQHPGQYCKFEAAFAHTEGSATRVELDDKFYASLKTLSAFNPNKQKNVYFKKGRANSALKSETASSFDCEGMPDCAFDSEHLLKIKDLAKVVFIGDEVPVLSFATEVARGAVMPLDMQPTAKLSEVLQPDEFKEEDIPF